MSIFSVADYVIKINEFLPSTSFITMTRTSSLWFRYQEELFKIIMEREDSIMLVELCVKMNYSHGTYRILDAFESLCRYALLVAADCGNMRLLPYLWNFYKNTDRGYRFLKYDNLLLFNCSAHIKTAEFYIAQMPQIKSKEYIMASYAIQHERPDVAKHILSLVEFKDNIIDSFFNALLDKNYEMCMSLFIRYRDELNVTVARAQDYTLINIIARSPLFKGFDIFCKAFNKKHCYDEWL